jgi:ribosome-binding protein aMBF1 (putative translation factor)
MSKVSELHDRWMKEDGYRAAYEELGPEFALSRAITEARARAQLTQAELAERMQTSQAAIARLESGRANPTAETLHKLAVATGTRLAIRFE